MKPLVIYHGNCADGFTSAWLFNMHYGESHPRIDGTMPRDWVVDHHAGVYNKPPPDVTGRTVYILDFSYPPEVMDEMAKRAARITVIDHHESAVRRLADKSWGNVVMILDTRRSGAYLTAQFLWPDREPSEMVKMVDDRDRWQFQIPDSRPFNAGLFSHLYTIEDWNNIAHNVKLTVADGIAIERKHHKDIEELIATCTMFRNVGGHEVPVINVPYTMASDACHKLLEKYPDVPFAAAWYHRADDRLVFSLRSRPDGFDVSALAEFFEGGGHKTASGFSSVVWPELLL